MGKDPSCSIPGAVDYSNVTIVNYAAEPAPGDYQQAMQLANGEAEQRLGEYMLLSWYDRDRDFESPQHASECHENSAIPSYVDYAIYHGATLKIDFEQGRFVFFYMPVEL
ncbi:MAG: AF1514 family protein [Gammaproteobacteria bacterium]|nr:AF1514 family protein [Gammaproteobacteria bacterium]